MQHTLGPAQQAPSTTRAPRVVLVLCLLLFCQHGETVGLRGASADSFGVSRAPAARAQRPAIWLTDADAAAWQLTVCLCVPQCTVQAAAQPGGVGIAGSWPSSLNQYVQTTVRVTLNTSACGQWGRQVRRDRNGCLLAAVGSMASAEQTEAAGTHHAGLNALLCVLHVLAPVQDAGDDAQLVLQHVTAQGGSLAFPTISPSAAADGSSARSADCTSFDFPVLLDGSSKHGNISARLLLPKAGLDLRLHEPIVVEVPLLLSVATRSINVSADSTPFAVGVSLNRPAPAGGVSVQLKLGQEEAARVRPRGGRVAATAGSEPPPSSSPSGWSTGSTCTCRE